MSKIKDWKQITTHRDQRSLLSWWFKYVKDQRLKANHNFHYQTFDRAFGDSSMSKIKDWKLITTDEYDKNVAIMVIQVCQRSKIESKSQHGRHNKKGTTWWFKYVKDQRLKANHNEQEVLKSLRKVIQVCQRSKIESKSQHGFQTNWGS